MISYFITLACVTIYTLLALYIHIQNSFEYLGVYICISIPQNILNYLRQYFKQNVAIFSFALIENKVCLKASVLCVLNFNPSFFVFLACLKVISSSEPPERDD